MEKFTSCLPHQTYGIGLDGIGLMVDHCRVLFPKQLQLARVSVIGEFPAGVPYNDLRPPCATFI